jgi:hypothetical protein
MKLVNRANNNLTANELRIGNIAIRIDQNEFDFVAAIEPGLIHLSRNTKPDDERNVFGVTITQNAMELLGFKKIKSSWLHSKTGVTLFQMDESDSGIAVALFNNMDSLPSFRYLHELQNAIFSIYRVELYIDFLASL